MKNAYLGQLPEKASLLVREIEEYSGRNIEVLPNPYPMSKTDPNPNGLACNVNEVSARILYRGNQIDTHAFTHELLHIHRYWVRQVPQILPVSDPNGSNIQVTSSIENALEHLVIVPEESQYGFEPYSHWNNTSLRNWERFNPLIMNKFAIRKCCLLGYLTVANLVNNPEIVSMAESVIKKQGFLQKAKQMNTKITKYINSKDKQISCIVEFLKIPRKEAKLVYLDVKNGTRIEKEIGKFSG
ncbi:hypothetical protein [uncultured Gilvimarinus sp.]|uniref:hypothetical protein n=1 Tax=uncultured Gilvimarinus sp. TaxID=1689143 RepID=UPI0030EDEEC1|tara:strand:- start:4736 stop:5461 length:726 start_codon:yes stop_codon:yes gene_type:complete